MKLFVFEGQRREPLLFDTIKQLFFSQADALICTYGSNIYSLYCELKGHDTFGNAHDGDIVSVLKNILTKRNDDTLLNKKASDFSEIFLFFDYDFQESKGTLEENNRCVHEMLNYFNDETENGKLYIHYPMVESLFYTKELPDDAYCGYVATRECCKNFKALTAQFSFYPSHNHVLMPSGEKRAIKEAEVRANWTHLIRMNVTKANFICHGSKDYPADKEGINQEIIYKNQLEKYVTGTPAQVSVLNSFPLFLYEYFPVKTFCSGIA